MTQRHVLVITDGADDDLRALALLDSARGIAIDGLVATSGSLWMSDAKQRLEALSVGPVHDGLPESDHQPRSGAPTTYRGAFDRPRPADRSIKTFAPPRRPTPPTVLLLGPATVLAHWLEARQGGYLGPILVFAGALAVPGNATARAEFNAWFDPPALDALLAAGLDVTLLPLDALGDLAWDRGWLTEFSALETPLAAQLTEMLTAKLADRERLPLWDEALVLSLIAPEVVKQRVTKALAVDADGVLVPAKDKRKPVSVITGLDLAACHAAVRRLCGRGDGRA